MAKRVIDKNSQHVIPNHKGGGWIVRKSDSSRASRTFRSKEEAVGYAKEVAKKHHTEVYIHRPDGMISSKDSYGKDPHPPRDKKH